MKKIISFIIIFLLITGYLSYKTGYDDGKKSVRLEDVCSSPYGGGRIVQNGKEVKLLICPIYD